MALQAIVITLITLGRQQTQMFKKLRRWFRRPPNPSGYVYYCRIVTSEGPLYKIGYTSKESLVDRFSYGKFGDENLIDREFFFAFRHDAWDVEQDLLEHFDKQRAFGKYSNDPALPLPGRGQSELFRQDILGLDDDLYRLSEDEMKIIRAEGERVGGGCLFVLLAAALAPFTLGLSLFLLAGGVSELFGSAASLPSSPRKPKHPQELQKLVDELRNTSSLSLRRPESGDWEKQTARR